MIWIYVYIGETVNNNKICNLFKASLRHANFVHVQIRWFVAIIPHHRSPTNQPQAAWNRGRACFMQSSHCHSLLKYIARLSLWEGQRIAKQHLAKLPIPTNEQLAHVHKSEWKLWKSLNGHDRLRTGMGRSKTNLSKKGYADAPDTACECGTSEQTMQHLLRCPILENECSLEDLATANEKALHCACKNLAKTYDPVQGWWIRKKTRSPYLKWRALRRQTRKTDDVAEEDGDAVEGFRNDLHPALQLVRHRSGEE